MRHRHLNHQELTLAAIDDIISRGLQQDWVELRQEVSQNRSLLKKIQKICETHISDPYAQRYHFWMNYVTEHSTSP